MAKKKDKFLDSLLSGMTFDQIRQLMQMTQGGHSVKKGHPYVEDHETLQVNSLNAKAYHLYISLQGSPVKIFRRITVPSNMRLEHLAEIIIRVMGWENVHLHQFVVDGEFYVSPAELKESMGFRVKHDAMATTISEVLKDKGKSIKFEYDFGDSWMHNVRLSSTDAFDPSHAVTVESGTGACPPEDIGGVWGYAQMLEEEGISTGGSFNLTAAKEMVGKYVSHVMANEKEYVEPEKKGKKGAKVVRMIPYTFGVADIRRLHPHDLGSSSTDQDYALLANRIERALAENPSSDFMDAEYMKVILSKVIMYYEDIIADAGMWRGFVNKNIELYGKPLPFYKIEGDYYPDEPHEEDIRLLIWDAMRELREAGHVTNPENPGIEQAARVIYQILDDEFENIGINERLADYFKTAPFADDFYETRDVLKWIFFDCYLTSDKFSKDILNDERDEIKPFFKGNEGAYVAECTVPFTTKVGMLALYPKEWLALFVGSKGNERIAKKIAAIEDTGKIDVLKMTSRDGKRISFVDISDKQIVIDRGYRFDIPDKDFEKGNGAIGSYAKYDGKWYLNGNQLWGYMDKVYDEMKEQQKSIENLSAHNYEHLMELSGGSPLFYFKNMTDYKKFLSTEAGWTKEEMSLLNIIRGAKDIVLFVQGRDKPLAITPGAARCICDKRNPYYDKQNASGYALQMLVDGKSCPGVIVQYLIRHNMLPDAALNSLKGEEYGRQLVQDNIDFLARAFRRNYY